LPTYFHAREPGRAVDLDPAACALLPAVLAAVPAAGELRIELFAELEFAHHIDDLAALDPLRGTHGLSDSCVAARFGYRKPGLWVMFLRTYRLRQALALADLAEYGGCTSW